MAALAIFTTATLGAGSAALVLLPAPPGAAPAFADSPSASYACPPGGEQPALGGLCSRSFVGLTEAFTEPDLAISPLDPDVMAIATNNPQTANVNVDAPAWHVQKYALFT
ncbi:MAG: hypothetical protein LC620_05795, partial [Halobacteriales archaeon]|nr:hypothetical protein [Halobacteriales archaeon]